MIKGDEVIKHIYSIDGKHHNEFQKGINIIELDNGTKKKIIVK